MLNGQHGGASHPALAVVVDDDKSVRRAVARLLRSGAFEVETCESAEEYLSSTRARAIACLILDVHLSEMSGLELLELIVAQGLAPPVIVITALDTPEVRERALELGAAEFFHKPFDPAALLDAVRNVVGSDAGPHAS